MKLLRSGAVVLAANLVEVGSALLRNVILARLLSVEQFGLAATFAILMTLIEAFQNAGLNRMIVQDRDADDPRFMASLHGAQIVIGVAAGAVTALLAWPYSIGMGTPGLLGAYLAMAAIPVASGFVHLGTYRAQRAGRFGPQALRSFLSQPIGLLAVFPGYWWFGDYRAMVVAIFAQQLSAIVLTHVAVGERFAVARDPAVWRRALAFGWPMTINGLLMFWVLNGDRMIVNNRFGAEALGLFSAALLLTLTPANLIAKTLQTITLPMLAREQDSPARFQTIHDRNTSLAALIALAMVAAAMLLGELAVTLLFGARYVAAADVLALLAAVSGLRLMRAMSAIAAMARGETRNPLYTNILRAATIPVALLVAIRTSDLAAMLWVGVAGEFASAAFSALLARRRAGVGARHFLIVLAVSTTAMALGIAAENILAARLALGPMLILALFACRNLLDRRRRPALA